MSSSKRKTIEINSNEEISPKNRRSSLTVNLSFTNFTDSGNGSLRKTHIKSNESSVQIQPSSNLLRDNKKSGKNKQSDKSFAEKSIVNKTNNVSSCKDQLLKNVSVRVIDIKHIKQTDASFQDLRDAILTKTREIFNKQDECAIKTTLVLENQNNQLLNTYSKNIENQQQLSKNGITNLQTDTQNNMVSIFSTPVKNCNDNESINKPKNSKRRLFMHNDIDYPPIVETAMKENHDTENNLRQLSPRNLNYKNSPIITGSHRRHHKSRLSLKYLSKNRTKCDADDPSQKSVSSLSILSNEIESLDTPILCSTFNEELCGNDKKFIEEHGINNERRKKSATVVSMKLTTVQNHSLEHYNTCNEKVDAINAINSNQISNKKKSEIQNTKEKINQTNSISDKESLMNHKTILITSNTLLQSSQFITERNESIKTTVNNENNVKELDSSLHVNTSMDNANEQENVTQVHGSLQVNTSLNSTYKHRQSHNKEQSEQRSTRKSERHSRHNNEITNENNDSSNYIQCTPYNVFQSNFPKSLSQMDTVIHNTKLKDSSKVIETLNKNNINKIDETVLSQKTEPCACKIHTTILCTKNRKDILRSTVILDDSPFIASNKEKCKEVIIDESLSQQVTDKDKIKNNSLKNINVIPRNIKKKKLLPLCEDSRLSFTPMEKSSTPTPLIIKKKKQFKKKKTMKQNLWTICNVPNEVEKSNNDLSENNFSFDLKKKKGRKNPRKVVSKKIVIKKRADSDILKKLEHLYKRSDQETEIIENENSMNEFQIKKGSSSRRPFHKSTKIVMVITGFSKGDKHLIKNIVKSLGMASIEQNVTRRTTHVVSTGVRTINLLHGIIRGCWLVKLEWVLKSLENNGWLNPEDYEMMHYSKAVKENRKDRELFGMAYVPDLFATSGFLHVENGTTPSAQVLKELIKAAGGRITEYPQAAKIIIGANGVKESWILDSITTGVLQLTAQYQRK
ncbi:PREDICTED: MATH and LRR domain-containing protein PFE0570w [Polistes canadensis]|uniref:MATH and LRR domain-containing protein PFE0570w n=1 Tax=Polistes canadensis TaxID=91411 RepID=UPI000718ACB6|nr:PREDICTED: MATH and LRR domain-containing protein PFE0570w [Polistes canadensis]